ncbi:hypothetical protein [Haloferax volcanii]|uniref:hypothetical protein n=1 Tax=Haloferax volcanii TaxID=2246 RepID=UPI0038542D4D
MSQRTEPTDAIERIAWALNFHSGESVSVNKLAEETDLSWATTKKYAKLLETVSRITPTFSSGDDGIAVKSVGKNLRQLRGQKDIQLLLYVLTQAENSGGPTEAIKISKNADVLSDYEAEIHELHELGLLECDTESGTIRLQPEGIGMVGPVRSQVRNTNTAEANDFIELDPNIVGKWGTDSEYDDFANTMDRDHSSERNNSGYGSTTFSGEHASAY